MLKIDDLGSGLLHHEVVSRRWFEGVKSEELLGCSNSGWFYYRVTELFQFLDLCLSLRVGRVVGYGHKVVVGDVHLLS